jgi:hypothetical protein
LVGRPLGQRRQVLDPLGISAGVATDLANGNAWVGGATAAGSEAIYVRASDGTDWSAWTSFTLTTLPNHAPAVTVNNHSLEINHWSSVKSWISLSDADGDAATQYQFWWGDPSASAAKFWTPAGNQPALNTLTVSAADVAMDNVWLGSATAAGSETIYVRASDGFDWGNWTSFTLTTLPNHAPTVAVNDHSLVVNGWSTVASWINYSDADSDPATQYQFWNGDSAPSAAKFWSPANGVQPAMNTLTVAAADVGNIWVGGATAAGHETMWVRAFDGSDWSNWDAFVLTIHV